MRALIISLLCCGCALADDQSLEIRGLNIRLLGSSANTGNDDNESTAAYMPKQGELLMAMAINTKASLPDTPTASGNGLTWIRAVTQTYNTVATPLTRLSVFYARATSGFFRGAFTASSGGVSQTGWIVAVVGIEGAANLGGPFGTNAFLQFAQTAVNANTNATVSLSALTGIRSMCLGFFGHDLNTDVWSAQNGYVKITSGLNYATPTTGGCIIWGVNDGVVVAATNAAIMDWGNISTEIRQPGDK